MMLEIVNTSEESSSVSNSPVSITIESISSEISSPLREKECRICFEAEKPDDPLLYPCLCDGFSKYIHTDCLLKWRIVNLEKPAFLKCMECDAQYNIKFPYLIETYTFPYEAIQGTISVNTTFVYLAILGSSLFFRTADRAFNTQIIYMIDPRPNKSFHDVLKNDTLYSTLFVFSCLNFIIFSLIHILFIFVISMRINNPLRYFKKMFIPFIFHLAFIANIYIFYYLFKSENSIHTPEIVINFSSLISLGNIAMYGKLMHRHNKIIRQINSRNIGDVLNRDEN